MTIIMCSRRPRRCAVVRVQSCPDCQDLIDLTSNTPHQCTLPLDLNSRGTSG